MNLNRYIKITKPIDDVYYLKLKKKSINDVNFII